MPLQLSRQNNCQIVFYSSFYYLDKSCGIYNLALKFKLYSIRQFTKQMSKGAWVGSGTAGLLKEVMPLLCAPHLPAFPSHILFLQQAGGKAQIKLSSAANFSPNPGDKNDASRQGASQTTAPQAGHCASRAAQLPSDVARPRAAQCGLSQQEGFLNPSNCPHEPSVNSLSCSRTATEELQFCWHCRCKVSLSLLLLLKCTIM